MKKLGGRTVSHADAAGVGVVCGGCTRKFHWWNKKYALETGKNGIPEGSALATGKYHKDCAVAVFVGSRVTAVEIMAEANMVREQLEKGGVVDEETGVTIPSTGYPITEPGNGPSDRAYA